MRAGPWGYLPSTVLVALTSSDQSPMVRRYLINGWWPAPIGISQGLPTAETLPKPTKNPELSSLSLTIRVVQPSQEETVPIDLQRRESKVGRLLRAFKRKLVSSRPMPRVKSS